MHNPISYYTSINYGGDFIVLMYVIMLNIPGQVIVT